MDIKEMAEVVKKGTDEILKLRAINADLLEACHEALSYLNLRHPPHRDSDTATNVLANILVEAIHNAKETQ